jgi:hypothetical protein
MSESGSDERGGEGEVLVATGEELGDEAVVRFQAQPSAGCGIGGVEGKPVAPVGGQVRGRDRDAVGVVAEAFVERGQFTDRAVGLEVVGSLKKPCRPRWSRSPRAAVGPR